jgi:xylan 1,4-beta-xylosidase
MYICHIVTKTQTMFIKLTSINFTILKKQGKNLFCALVASIAFSGAASAQNSNRVITVDYTKSAGKLNTMFKECVGAGRANEGLRADWQQQLAYVKKECDFKYIRMHGLLTDDMAIYKEDNKGNAEYNYMYVDALYDYLLSIGIKPFVELGFMPSQLASGSKTIFWWRGNVTPPKDYGKWEALIKNLTAHFTERYGAEEVKTWYFEVWNEPNLDGFWAGTQDEYYKLYASAAKAIKSVNKDYKVGGPATAGAAWIPETLEFCKKNNVPIDFASTHSYGVNQGFLDEFGNSGTVLSKDPMAVSGDVINSRKQIQNSAFPNIELHYTEWSSSYTPADPIHDSYHEAAYILEKLKQVGTTANSMSYWVFTDIFEEAGPRFTPFHGGFGLLNTQGINKPAFYSYQFLNKLGDTELTNTDTRSWAAKNSKGDVQLLFWDFTYTDGGEGVNNQQYYIRDLPAKAKGKTTVAVNGMPKGKYRMELYKVGYKANDAYATYMELGKPSQLTKKQLAEIKSKNDGKPFSTENVTIKADGAFSKEIDLRENDVILVNLVKL